MDKEVALVYITVDGCFRMYDGWILFHRHKRRSFTKRKTVA
jgi:hypothetical protein